MMNTNIFKRNGRLYIDCQNSGERRRFSTGLKADSDNLAFVKKHYELFLKDKNLALSKHKAFVDKRFDERNEPKPKRAKKAEFDVRTLLEKVLNEKSFLKSGTRKGNEGKARKLLSFLDSLKICDIRQIKREHCVLYAKFLNQKGLKSGTCKNAMVMLRQLLEFALHCGAIDKSPYFMPKMRSDDTLKINPFSLNEAQILIKNAKGDKENPMGSKKGGHEANIIIRIERVAPKKDDLAQAGNLYDEKSRLIIVQKNKQTGKHFKEKVFFNTMTLKFYPLDKNEKPIYQVDFDEVQKELE